MAKVNNIKRIVAEDFEQEDQELVKQLGFSLNPMLEQLTSAFNKGIDFDNLNQEVSIFETTVNASGVPLSELSLKVSLRTKLKGTSIISVQNLTDGTLLAGAPFINYELVANGIKINQITGLVANKKYRITSILIG